MKSEILSLLRESENYVSGQELCERFQVSRTAVWKVINQLKEVGYKIEAVQNKGYRLLGSPDILEEYELKSRIHTKWAGREIHYKEETGSTNIDIKNLAEAGAPHGTLAVAGTQVNGRGRRGHGWESPAGEAIFMSLLVRPDFSPGRASMLTLLMGLSVAQAVTRMTGLEAGIKWPNDVVVNKKKICGILTEMSAEADYIQYLVIGVGINVNNESFPEEIRDVATSLWMESGRKGEKFSRSLLIQYVMEAFEKNYGLFLETEDLSLLTESYNALLVNRNAQVKVLDPKGEYTGIAREVDKKGNLLVERENGKVMSVYSGEVSVRGLYGYV